MTGSVGVSRFSDSRYWVGQDFQHPINGLATSRCLNPIMVSSGWFGSIAVTLLGLSAFTCGTLVFGGARRRRLLLARQHRREPSVAAPPAFVLGQTPFVSTDLDVADEIRDVLQKMAFEASRHLVQLEFAVQPDLSVRADRLALHMVLSELLRKAVHHAPGGRVLLSATRLGGRVQIAVIDDGAGPDAAVQEAALREITQLVALQGGTVEVETHQGEGTTVLVRLPEPMETGRPATETPQQQPAESRAPSPQAEAVTAQSWEI
jgi:anti-sigma regulatory factor (Ser/Thr protein kinase)